MAIVIREVTCAQEKLAVYQLRYRVFVEELGAKASQDEHDRRALSDALDSNELLLGAFDSGRLVGSVRGNHAEDCPAYLRSRYDLQPLIDAHPRFVTVTTRMVVERDCRYGLLGARLSKALFERYLDRGIRYDCIDCQEHMRLFFLRLGYRPGAEPFIHPDSGRTHFPMILDVSDLAHFVAIRSPFAQLAARRPVAA